MPLPLGTGRILRDSVAQSSHFAVGKIEAQQEVTGLSRVEFVICTVQRVVWLLVKLSPHRVQVGLQRLACSYTAWNGQGAPSSKSIFIPIHRLSTVRVCEFACSLIGYGQEGQDPHPTEKKIEVPGY